MRHTLLGKIMAPFAKFFTMMEMRLHINIFAQQGLVKMIKIRLLRIDCCIWTNILEEVFSSNTLLDRRITKTIQFASLSLDSQSS